MRDESEETRDQSSLPGPGARRVTDWRILSSLFLRRSNEGELRERVHRRFSSSRCFRENDGCARFSRLAHAVSFLAPFLYTEMLKSNIEVIETMYNVVSFNNIASELRTFAPFVAPLTDSTGATTVFPCV